MWGKPLLSRLDLIIVAALVVFAGAMSGISIRSSLSQVDTSKQTNALIPYVTKGPQQSLQFNSIGFKTNQPTPEQQPVFACPGKDLPPQVPDQPQPSTCPPVTCQSCDGLVGGCGRPWQNTTCHPCPITDCTKQCPAHSPPPTPIPYVPPPVIK